MGEAEGKEWYMASYALEGVPTSDHLKLRSIPVPQSPDALPDDHIAVETLWISVDPYLRSRMTGRVDGLSFPSFAIDEAIKNFGIGKVMHSKNSNYQEGDIVLDHFFNVANYCVFAPTAATRKLDPTSGVDLPDYLSCLGLPGFTAWIGIVLLGEPTPGCNVFVSAAAGAVGMFAGQLAKLRGCRVVGSAGSDEKVKVLKEEFGFDDALNYNKEADLDAALSKYFPNGIDIYFDNVGGKTLEAALNHINTRARIPLCGMISEYNTVWTERGGVRNLLNLIGKEAKMQGFLMSSYLEHYGDFMKEVEGYVREGKLKYKHKIYNGIDSFLEGMGSIFTSANIGKVLVQVK